MVTGRIFIGLSFCLFLGFLGCVTASGPDGKSASGVASDVLTPVDAPQPTPVPEKTERPPSPAYEKLRRLLESQGYTGVGLQYESNASLELLYKVFSNPAAKNLKLKLVYTGLQMSFDPVQQSLTIGGAKDAKSILRFIRKNIGKRSGQSVTPRKKVTKAGPKSAPSAAGAKPAAKALPTTQRSLPPAVPAAKKATPVSSPVTEASKPREAPATETAKPREAPASETSASPNPESPASPESSESEDPAPSAASESDPTAAPSEPSSNPDDLGTSAEPIN